MERLIENLFEQFKMPEKLERKIKENLAGLGYDL
jgi:hypothetical protein